MPIWWERLLHIVTGHSSEHAQLPDLRTLPSRRVAVQRTAYLVNDPERRSQRDRLYVLRREGRRDVAVYSNGRAVGFLPHADRAAVGELLEEVGGSAVVNGAGPRTGSMRLRVDIPTDRALADYERP